MMRRIPYSKGPQRLLKRTSPRRHMTKRKPHRFAFPHVGTFSTTAEYVARFCDLNHLIP